jgi:hypothetical protein
MTKLALRIDVTETELARFVGPWSVSRKTVDVLLYDWDCPNQTAERFTGLTVGKYLASIRALVAELETKAPEFDELPFWRDAVAFWKKFPSDVPEPAPAPVKGSISQGVKRGQISFSILRRA